MTRVHDLFRIQAALSPKSLAVIDPELGCSITYDELDKRSNQLANHLLRKRVSKEEIIGVCVDRSIDIVIAFLAILKVGAAYVPLDPDEPKNRLKYILEDCQPRTIVTMAKYGSKFEGFDHLKLILLGKDAPFLFESIAPSFQEVNRTNLAYVIYTSGSTGSPKGVMIEHRSIENITDSLSKLLALTPEDKVLQFNSLIWDTCGEEIYPTLASGACIVLRTKDMFDPITSFLKKCDDWGITIINVPTAFWHTLTSYGLIRPGIPLSLRKVVIGGEQPSIEKYREWERIAPPTLELINTYGLTEAGMISTYFSSRNLNSDSICIPIGKPIPNVEVFVLDENLQPTPEGEHGFLYIGGNGVARGYVNHPDLNKYTFVRYPPVSSEMGIILCRTGDLVKTLPDGNLEFLGRRDYQVKFRGHRVELREVESIILTHPNVNDCAVIFKKKKRALAFVVPRHKDNSTLLDLQKFTLNHLPQYMQPINIVLMDKLPLTPNGKIDRIKLSNQKIVVNPIAEEKQTPIEQILSKIISDVVGIKVERGKNFFDLGIDSLSAIQISLDIEDALEVGTITTKQMFDNPTIRDLSASIVKSQLHPIKSRNQHELVRVLKTNKIPLSFNQQEWLFHSNPSLSINYDLIFRLRGEIDFVKIERALNKIIERHGILRTIYKGQNSSGSQEVLPFEYLPLKIIETKGFSESQQEDFLDDYFEKQQTHLFDRTSENSIRFSVIKTHSIDHILAIFFDHIAFDDWSSKIFLDEFSWYYNELIIDQSIDTLKMPLQYIDFSSWQAQSYNRGRMDMLLEFWRNQFAQHTLGIELPSIDKSIQTGEYNVLKENMILDRYLVERIGMFSSSSNVSLYISFLTALVILIYYLTEQDDIVVHTHLANRSVAGSAGIIGDFAHSSFVRTQVFDEMLVSELIKQIRERVYQIQLYSGISTFMLAKILNVNRIEHSMVGFELINESNFYQMKLAGLDSEVVHPKMDVLNTAMFVTITISKSGSAFVNFSYNPRFFLKERIKQLMDIYKQILVLIDQKLNLNVKDFTDKLKG